MRSSSADAQASALSIKADLDAGLACVRAALDEPGFQRIAAALPADARAPEFWFGLLSGYPLDGARVARLKELKRRVASAVEGGYSLERYGVLRSLQHAAPQWASHSLPPSIIRFCTLFCEEVAVNEAQWASMFDVDNEPQRFDDLAKIATLRRFIAGEVGLSYERVPPARGVLSVHPLALPGYLAQLALVMRGIQPIMSVHLNYGRKGSLILSRENFERSLWRLAKTIEMQPHLKGINTAAWLYSKVTGEVTPHMAWMRDLFLEGGAYLVDMQPHPADRYSFTHNNKKRQQLYDAGKFCPRYTAVYWQRDDFLRWAAARPRLADPLDGPIQAPEKAGLFLVASPKPAAQTKRNSPITLWNGVALADRVGLVRYIALTMVAPGLAAAGLCVAAGRPLLAPFAFLATLWSSQAVQYFISQ